VPTQNANRHLNQWAFQKYIASDPAIPPKLRDGVKLLNDLIDTSPFRPVTPVGQLLFNEQKRATENAIFHKMTAQEALNQSTQVVQSALDRVLSPPRGVIVPWKYFLAVYFLLITAAAIGIYLWETRTRFPHAPAPTRARKKEIEQEHAYEQEAGGTPSRYFRSQWASGWLCASPWIIGFILFTGGPILFAIVVSFYSESGTLCRLGKLSLDVHAGPVVLESDWQYCFHDHRHSTRHGVEPGHRSSAQP